MPSPPLPPRQPRSNPRFLTPALLFLLFLTLALSVSFATLAADTLHYAATERDDSNYYFVEILKWWEGNGTEIERGVIEYSPKHLELGGLKAVMAAGMIGAVGSLVVGVLWVLRARVGNEEDDDGVVKPKLTWVPLTTFTLTILTFFLTLIIAISTRSHYWPPGSPTPVVYPEYFTPPLSGTWNTSVISTYDSPVHYTPIEWNCQISSVLEWTYPAGSVRRLCREGRVVWDLMVPAIVLQGLMVALVGWVGVREWNGRRAAQQQQ